MNEALAAIAMGLSRAALSDLFGKVVIEMEDGEAPMRLLKQAEYEK